MHERAWYCDDRLLRVRLERDEPGRFDRHHLCKYYQHRNGAGQDCHPNSDDDRAREDDDGDDSNADEYGYKDSNRHHPDDHHPDDHHFEEQRARSGPGGGGSGQPQLLETRRIERPAWLGVGADRCRSGRAGGTDGHDDSPRAKGRPARARRGRRAASRHFATQRPAAAAPAVKALDDRPNRARRPRWRVVLPRPRGDASVAARGSSPLGLSR